MRAAVEEVEMPLSAREQWVLAEIEDQLNQQDPGVLRLVP
jgi:hypothetical protein